MSEEELGIDIRFDVDVIPSLTGDMETISAWDNVKQALWNRLRTYLSSLPAHPEYGSLLLDLVSAPNTEETRALAEYYVRQALMEDPRIAIIQDLEVISLGEDGFRIWAQVTLTTDETGEITLTVR